MPGEDLEVMRRMIESFNRGDVDGVVSAFDPACTLTEPPEMPDRSDRGYEGHDGIRAWMANLREIAEVRFEVHDLTHRGEVIVSEWVARGTGRLSGTPIEWRTFAVLRVRDGKIATAQGFLSRGEALAAAGQPM